MLKRIFNFLETKKDLYPEHFDIYQIVREHIRLDRNKCKATNIWNLVEKNVDIQLQKPQRKEKNKYELIEQKNKKNEISYIIKDIDENIYISLNKEEFYVWELLDGNATIRDICNDYFNKYKKLSNMPLKLIKKLEKKNMLANQWWNIYDTVHRIQKGGLLQRLKRISSFFLNSKISLKKIDGVISFLYDKFTWVLFRKEVIYFYYIIIISGLYVFFTMGYFEQKYSLKKFLTIKPSLGIILLFSILPVVLHEFSHAFACKKYGRKINRAGFMLYIGLPMLFVETTDIWMKSKKERIFVSVAGPFTDLLVGSVCFLLHKSFGNIGILQILPIVGLIAYIRCLYNFNPLLEFDGYYILMDLLDIPELRKKSFNFIRKGGLKKLLTQKLEKQEYILFIYGIIAAIYTYWMIFFMIYMWQTKIHTILIEIWGKKHSSIFSQILIMVTLLFIFIRFMFMIKLVYKKMEPVYKRLFSKDLSNGNTRKISIFSSKNKMWR